MEKLKVALEDRPVDVELARYKRMFEAACSALASIGDALGVEPEEGGAEPILSAIAELKTAHAHRSEQEPVEFRFPRDTESWTGGWTIDYKVIRSVDAEIEDNEFKPCLESVEQVLLALEKVYAAPQPVKQEPVAWAYEEVKSAFEYLKLQVKGPDDKWTVGESCTYFGFFRHGIDAATQRRTAPVRTKDLTKEDKLALWKKWNMTAAQIDAVIAAYKEKNK